MAKTDTSKSTSKTPGQKLKETVQTVLEQSKAWKTNLATAYAAGGAQANPVVTFCIDSLNKSDDTLLSELAKTPAEVTSAEDQEKVVSLVDIYLISTTSVYDPLLKLPESESFKNNQYQQLSNSLKDTQKSLQKRKTEAKAASVSPGSAKQNGDAEGVDEDEDEDMLPADQVMAVPTRKGIGLTALEGKFLGSVGHVAGSTSKAYLYTQAVFHKSKKPTLKDSDIEKLIDAWKHAVNEIITKNKDAPDTNELSQVATLIGTHALIEVLYDELISHTGRTGADDLAAQILSLY